MINCFKGCSNRGGKEGRNRGRNRGRQREEQRGGRGGGGVEEKRGSVWAIITFPFYNLLIYTAVVEWKYCTHFFVNLLSRPELCVLL